MGSILVGVAGGSFSGIGVGVPAGSFSGIGVGVTTGVFVGDGVGVVEEVAGLLTVILLDSLTSFTRA